MTKTILFVCHNHPAVRPGGAEGYAYELFEAFRSSAEFTPVFLAKGGPPLERTGRTHVGTFFASVDGKPDEYFFYTDGYSYDWLNGTISDKDFYTRHFRRFLEGVRPDIVHFQHTQFLGFDAIREVRNSLPGAPIVYTLHEYSAICHRQGQMLRTFDGLPCPAESPRRCHDCFPEITPQDFFMRRRFIQSHLDLVDRFVSPSRFLIERFVEWGIDPGRLIYEENGRVLAPPVESSPRPHRDRFAFFGQFSPYKGVDVLLEAMAVLDEDPTRRRLGRPLGESGGPQPHLWIHGANLEIQEGPFQERIRSLVAAAQPRVTLAGGYGRQQIGALMAAVDWVVIPSIWYENAPLVIQEAFMHGRPVICSDVGGMAEKVVDGVSGLHFRRGDGRSLAGVIRRAAGDPGLWDRLRQGIPSVHGMEIHVKELSDIYLSLLEERSRCRRSS